MRALVAIIFVAFGCGSEESSERPASGGAQATGGAGGTSGSGGASGNGGNAGSAGNSGAAGAAGAPTCVPTEITTIKDEPTYAIARFAYPSTGGMKVYGETCQPKGPGPHPVVIWNHGGFSGLGAGDRQICENFTKNLGYAVVMSEYRGEGGSEGKIEVCLGEADDVIALAGCITQAPQLDPKRVVMAGGSHGGCITLRAIQKGAPVAAAIDIFGPSDLAAEHAFWTDELAKNPSGQIAATYQALIQIVETATGGPPSAAPAEYQKRSPASFAPALTSFPGSVLIVHGTVDVLVPASESCKVAGLAGGFEARHFAADATSLVTAAPAGCEADGLTWLSTPKPSPGWAGQRHLEVYEGAGHDFSPSVPGQSAMVTDFVEFVVAKMPP